MKPLKRVLIGAATTLVVASSAVVMNASPAFAEVWSCRAGVNNDLNAGWAVCEQGFGYYHVNVTCNSAHWPYSRTIDGPRVYKEQGFLGPESTVRGEPNGCHVVDARVVAD